MAFPAPEPLPDVEPESRGVATVEDLAAALGLTPDTDAVPDYPPGTWCCDHCGRADRPGGMVWEGGSPDAVHCADAEWCDSGRQVRQSWFRRRWRELAQPTTAQPYWHWVQKQAMGKGDSDYPLPYQY
jgi:hypothetical protein